MIPSFRTAAAALILVAVSVSACGKKAPEVKPPPPPPPNIPATTTPPPPPPARPPDPTPTAPAALTEDEIFAKSTPDDLTKSGVLKPVYFAVRLGRADRGGARHPSEEYGVPEAPVEHEDPGRGPRRLTRHQRVQPRARESPGRVRPCVSGQPRRRRRPHDHREQGRGTALLQGRDGSLLAAEPGGLFHFHGKVGSRLWAFGSGPGKEHSDHSRAAEIACSCQSPEPKA